MKPMRLAQGAALALGALLAPLALSAKAAGPIAATAVVCEHTCKTQPDRPCVACLEEQYERDMGSATRDFERRAHEMEREAQRHAKHAERETLEARKGFERALNQREHEIQREEQDRERAYHDVARNVQREMEQLQREAHKRVEAEKRRIGAHAQELEQQYTEDPDGLEAALEELEDELESICEEIEDNCEEQAERLEEELEVRENDLAIFQEDLEDRWEEEAEALEEALEQQAEAFEEQVEAQEEAYEQQREQLERQREELERNLEHSFENASNGFSWSITIDDDGDCDPDCDDSCSECRKGCGSCCEEEEDGEDDQDEEERGSVVQLLERALHQAGLGSGHGRERKARDHYLSALENAAAQQALVNNNYAFPDPQDGRGLQTILAPNSNWPSNPSFDWQSHSQSSCDQKVAPSCDGQAASSCDTKGGVVWATQAPKDQHGYQGLSFQVNSQNDTITVVGPHGATGAATLDELAELPQGSYILDNQGDEIFFKRAECGDKDSQLIVRVPRKGKGFQLNAPSGHSGVVSLDQLQELDSGVYVFGDAGQGLTLLPRASQTARAPRAARTARVSQPAQAPLPVRIATTTTASRAPRADGFFVGATSAIPDTPEAPGAPMFFTVPGTSSAPAAGFSPSQEDMEELSSLLRDMREEVRELRAALRELRQEVRSLPDGVR